MNPPRDGKALLVLDLDHTLLDFTTRVSQTKHVSSLLMILQFVEAGTSSEYSLNLFCHENKQTRHRILAFVACQDDTSLFCLLFSRGHGSCAPCCSRPGPHAPRLVLDFAHTPLCRFEKNGFGSFLGGGGRYLIASLSLLTFAAGNDQP